MSDPLDSLLDRPIAFQRGYVTITGSITAALMLSQAYYWSGRTGDPDGWFYKTQEEWTKETGMTRLEQESARKILRELGLVEENYERLTHRMWYRLDKSKLRSLCLRMSETDIGECGKPAVGNAGNRHSCNSAETTTETTVKGFEKEKNQSIQKPSSQKPSPTPSLSPLMNDAAFCAEWEHFIEHRKKLKKPLTGRAEQIILKKLEQRPQRAIEALQKCMEKGWQSFEWDYLDQQPRNGNSAAAFTAPPKVTMTRL